MKIKVQLVLLFFLCLFTQGVLAQNEVHFKRSNPEAEGISSEAILSFIESAEKEIDALHSYMIIRHGKLVSEGWWAPYGPETPHVMHSLSKSFTSTAIGFAVQEELLSLDDLVISFFPDKKPEKPSWHWNEMRIRDLLTMNTGHLEEPFPDAATKDWVKHFLASEVKLMPGSVFKYNSMATYMLSAILQKVTGEKLVDYLEPRLFDPLNIEKPIWDSCPRGINVGGWGLHIKTEDIAKLGQLYLQKGKWKGQQLLNEDWVAMATSKQVSNGSNPENDWAQGYGFQFWQCRHGAYRGDGAMGQFCIVMPDKEAVVAITAGVYDMGKVMQLVWDILLPAMKEDALPFNPAKWTALRKKSKDLKLKPLEAQSEGKVIAKPFNLDKNNAGVKSILFNLEVEKPNIQIEMEHGIEQIPVGIGKYAKGKLKSHLPYTDRLEKEIAASGAWTNANEYQLRVYLYGSPASITYTFNFEEEGLKWESKLDHTLFGRRDIQELRASH